MTYDEVLTEAARVLLLVKEGIPAEDTAQAA